MVQSHDEPFALWRQWNHKGAYNVSRRDQLLARIEDWNLFHAFLIIDGCTEGKTRAPLEWWFEEVKGKIATSINHDLLTQLSI